MSRVSISGNHTFYPFKKSLLATTLCHSMTVDTNNSTGWCGTIARPSPNPGSLTFPTTKTLKTLTHLSSLPTMAPQRVLTLQPVTKHEQKLQAIKIAGGKAPATLTEADLKKDLPEKAPDVPSSGEASYTCVTQRAHQSSSPAAIMVGLSEQIPRWKLGSVINFATYADGYPAPGDAIYAANCLIQAAEVWSSAEVGVKFKWVPKVEDAAFVLAYGGELGSVLARAFFPTGP